MKNKNVRRILILVCLAVMLFSGYKLINIYIEYKSAENMYDEIALNSIVPELDGISAGDVFQNDLIPFYVDFDALRQQYPNIVGWIYCEDTAINYPVVQYDDNSYYLHHMPDGTEKKSGSIFVDCRNFNDCSDRNTVLYGHNMKNGSMFAGIKRFTKQEYYDEHQIMWYFTPGQVYKVELVAGILSNDTSEAFNIFQTDEELDGFLSWAVEESYFKTDVDINSVDRIMTMCTCSYEYSTARFFLIGSLVPVNTAF